MVRGASSGSESNLETCYNTGTRTTQHISPKKLKRTDIIKCVPNWEAIAHAAPPLPDFALERKICPSPLVERDAAHSQSAEPGEARHHLNEQIHDHYTLCVGRCCVVRGASSGSESNLETCCKTGTRTTQHISPRKLKRTDIIKCVPNWEAIAHAAPPLPDFALERKICPSPLVERDAVHSQSAEQGEARHHLNEQIHDHYTLCVGGQRSALRSISR